MPEQPRTAFALAALATLARPGLDVVATQPSREPGADFDVVGLVDSDGRRWIVRSPRHLAAGAEMEGEVALLGELADAVDRGLLPFDVPRPVGFAPLPEGGRAMLYPELLGRPLETAALSPASPLLRALARALAALHELSGAVVRTAGLPDYDADSYRTRRLAELDEAARTGHLPARLLRRWEHALEDVSLWRFATTPVHGDLANEHVIVDGDEVVGIVDWSEARVADPADDLAWLLAQLSPEAADALMSHYAAARDGGVDDAFDARTTLSGELAVARWLMHGVRIRSDEVIEDAVDMLRELDHALADAPPIATAVPVLEAVEVDDAIDAGVDVEPALPPTFAPGDQSADHDEIEADDAGPLIAVGEGTGDDIASEMNGSELDGSELDGSELDGSELDGSEHPSDDDMPDPDDNPTTELPELPEHLR